MKVKIIIPPEAYGLHAAFIAVKRFDPIKQPEEYKKHYKKIFNQLKKRYGKKK